MSSCAHPNCMQTGLCCYPYECPEHTFREDTIMATTMRAKMTVQKVTRYQQGEEFYLAPVTSGKFNPDGIDEDNTYSKYSPSGDLRLMVTNPAILGKINPGETFYIDFTPADV